MINPESIGELWLKADRLRLEQALTNVVDNALRHGSGTVTLSARALEETVELRVTDEGAGFPAEFIDRAFDRFSRADSARTGGGTGLGLAIVDAIARAHGGSTNARNGEAGADVRIVVPAAGSRPSPS